MNRTLKVILAGWGIGFGLAVLGLLTMLWLAGPEKAELVFAPVPLTILLVVGVVVSARWLK